jgi:RNA polymerase sigma-70 factor, ECF subfamily
MVSERERYANIAKQCQALLLSAARRLVRGDDDRAQDLVQEALIKGYESFRVGRFLELGKPCAYLSRILTNHFINEYRRTKKWDAGVTVDTLTAGGEIGPASTRELASDAALITQTLSEPLEKALGALPEALRMTVILVDVEDRSYQEAADLLGVPIGTVRSRLARARYQLQELLVEFARDRRLI